MVDRFILANAVKNDTPGGNNNSSPKIPRHKHEVAAANTVLNSKSVNHRHLVDYVGITGTTRDYSWRFESTLFHGLLAAASRRLYTDDYQPTKSKGNFNISNTSPVGHFHSIDATVSSDGNGTAIDIRPDYYRVIFIIKMA